MPTESITGLFQKLSISKQKSGGTHQQQQKQQKQQYMVPFLFQQSIQKRFEGLDLFYYDEVWSPTQQTRSGIRASFQDQYPGLQQVQKNSASPSVIYRGTYKGRRIFVKSFLCGRTEAEFDGLRERIKALAYEKEVYRYIRSVAEKDDEIRRHFINMLFCAKDATNGIAYIFSQDSGGRPLKEYLKQERLTHTFLVGVMTQYLYILHLLHDKLKTTHNDLHTGNLIVVRDNQPNKTYSFGGKTFRLRDHPYTLMVYDFDQASMFEPAPSRNPFLTYLCQRYGRCPNYPATDLYLYLKILIDHCAPEHYASDRDEVLYTLLLSAYQILMPDDLSDQIENRTLHYAPCSAITRDNHCVLSLAPPTLHYLVGLWHKVLHTPLKTLDPFDMLNILVGFKHHFGIYIFMLMKEDEYYITTKPKTREIRQILRTNKIIEKGNVASLITNAPDEEDARDLKEIFLAQYENTKTMTLERVNTT